VNPFANIAWEVQKFGVRGSASLDSTIGESWWGPEALYMLLPDPLPFIEGTLAPAVLRLANGNLFPIQA